MSNPSPTNITYQGFKNTVPNAHKYSRKELRKAYREYLKYAKEKAEAKPVIDTEHSLPFEQAPWNRQEIIDRLCEELNILDDDPYSDVPWMLYRVGTVEGQFRVTDDSYEILSIINNAPGNGHLTDLLQWFYYACIRSQMPLRILSFYNQDFKQHLIDKKGFTEINGGVELSWEEMIV